MESQPGTSPALPHTPVLLFGLNNRTTQDVLYGLLRNGIRPMALVLPDSAVPHLLPGSAAYYVAQPPNARELLLTPRKAADVVEQAWAAELVVWVVRDLADPAVVAALRDMGAQAGVVACFSRRIPPKVLALMPLGVLNLHPSLLPHYRGPVPLFWQFRRGETQFGVTVHLMDAGLDTGPILAQERIAVAAGEETTLSARLNAAGTKLLVEQLGRLADGTATPAAQPDGGSYFGRPEDDDFVIPGDWTAVRAYTFMRGTEGWGRPYPVTVHGQTLRLARALAYSDDRVGDEMEIGPDGRVRVPLAVGTLWANLAASEKVPGASAPGEEGW